MKQTLRKTYRWTKDEEWVKRSGRPGKQARAKGTLEALLSWVRRLPGACSTLARAGLVGVIYTGGNYWNWG